MPQKDWRAPLKGVIHVTGMPDSGKTTFATSVPGTLPEDIAFFDFDGKSAGLAEELAEAKTPFFYYENTLVTLAKKKPVDVYEAVNSKIDELKRKKAHIPIVVFDNWSPTMEEALRSKGMSILSDISDISAGQAKAISQITWPATKRFYAQWLQAVANWADMVFIITHTKAYQIGQIKVPGVYESRGQDVLTQLPVLRMWLLSSQANNGAPDGLVMKRISKRVITPEGMQIVTVLPPRISPCTWKQIYKYMDEPVGLRNPRSDELPSPWEATLVGGEYLPDQKQAIMAAMEIAKTQTADELDAAQYEDLNLSKFVKEREDLPPVKILALAQEAGYKVETVADIVRLMQ